MPVSLIDKRNVLAQSILTTLVGFVISRLIDATGLEAVIVVLCFACLSFLSDALASFGKVFIVVLGSVVLVSGVSTTLFRTTVPGSVLTTSIVIGLIAMYLVHRKKGGIPRGTSSPSSWLLPGAFLLMSLILFLTRFNSVTDINSRWWLLSQVSEDNAAWLNMLARAAVRSSIAYEDVQNLGHTLPSLFWIFQRVGDILPGRSVLTSAASDSSEMAAGVLVLEALLISTSVFLAASTVFALSKAIIRERAWLVGSLLACPAAVAALLGGLVLTRGGYLSALAALVGLQVIVLTVVRSPSNKSYGFVVAVALLTGLSWFPIIPIILIGLIFLGVVMFQDREEPWFCTKVALLTSISLVWAILGIHLFRLLRRYPDVDRLQGVMWIGSQNLVAFFVILLLTATLLSAQYVEERLRVTVLASLGIPAAWLSLVWFNDLLRTGDPGHYGTTKLTFVVMYGLMPIALAVVMVSGVLLSRLGPSVLVAFCFAAGSTVGVTALSNDSTSQWPRKPTEEEIGQNPVIGRLALLEEAAQGTPSSVICMLVGDFEATGAWAASYNCNRWGSSLAGVDGPASESFRQVLLGNSLPQPSIRSLRKSGFFNDIAIVTDNPERFIELDPWGVATAARKGNGVFVYFRPGPVTISIRDLKSDIQ